LIVAGMVVVRRRGQQSTVDGAGKAWAATFNPASDVYEPLI
jgi:hypothetical protein